MISLPLNNALTVNLQFDPEYDHGLSNHLSMGAVGLQILSEEKPLPRDHIKIFAEDYVRKMEPLRLGPPILDFTKLSDGERLSFLGYRDNFDTWYPYFQKILTLDNYETVTGQWLKNLGNGLSAVAGHGLLRVYFALRSKPYIEEKIFLQELAMALAYFACRYLALRQNGFAGSVQIPFADGIHRVPTFSESAGEKIQGSRLITSRMVVCSWETSFQNFVAAINPHYDLLGILESLSTLAVAIPNFTLLHVLTVGQAMIGLKELLPNLEEATLRSGFIDFVVATFMEEPLTWNGDFSELSLNREDVLNLVPHAKDVHSIKALYALLDLHRRTGKSIFLYAAECYFRKYQ